MSTYTPIASQTLLSTSTSITFSNIPQGYTDLVIVADILGASATADAVLRFNSDTSANYSSTVIRSDGSTSASTQYSESYINAGRSWGSGIRYTHLINILNYSNNTTYKTALCRTNDAGGQVGAIVILWRKTPEAINSIQISTTPSANITTGSTFSLYGIQAGGPKAYGGAIVSKDSTYWYHAFTGSGTFTPTAAITADFLVVAGGGPGGIDIGGGGGAGGVVYTSSQSLTSGTTYNVLIGAGGSQNAFFQGVNGSNSNVTGGSLSLTAAVGGGYGGDSRRGNNGGSGGGGGGDAYNSGSTAGTGTSGQGNNGGAGGGGTYPTNVGGGGGGGAGGAGVSAAGSSNGFNGGAGINTYSTWHTATSTGVSGYIAGGGGGGSKLGSSAGTGGSGGGGNGALGNTGTGTTSGTVNTGSGGGGKSTGSSSGTGNGGSGLVIVRYTI